MSKKAKVIEYHANRLNGTMFSAVKQNFDSSPLTTSEKLFYGVRKNPAPRKDRQYHKPLY